MHHDLQEQIRLGELRSGDRVPSENQLAAAYQVSRQTVRKALAILVVSTGSAVLAEWLYDHFMHKKNTVKDFSAVVTGLLIGLNMPAGIPLWIPVLGCVFAIIVVKQLFGGLGQNFMNPALAARCFLMISFAGKMTDFSVSDSF